MWEILEIQAWTRPEDSFSEGKETSIRNYSMAKLVLRTDKYTTRKTLVIEQLH